MPPLPADCTVTPVRPPKIGSGPRSPAMPQRPGGRNPPSAKNPPNRLLRARDPAAGGTPPPPPPVTPFKSPTIESDSGFVTSSRVTGRRMSSAKPWITSEALPGDDCVLQCARERQPQVIGELVGLFQRLADILRLFRRPARRSSRARRCRSRTAPARPAVPAGGPVRCSGALPACAWPRMSRARALQFSSASCCFLGGVQRVERREPDVSAEAAAQVAEVGGLEFRGLVRLPGRRCRAGDRLNCSRRHDAAAATALHQRAACAGDAGRTPAASARRPDPSAPLIFRLSAGRRWPSAARKFLAQLGHAAGGSPHRRRHRRTASR